MGGSNFDLITQELLKQQRLMEELEEENEELRRQLADLRAGRGIFVEICGQRFMLETEGFVLSLEAAPLLPDVVSASPDVVSASAEQNSASPDEAALAIASSPTQAMASVPLQEAAEAAPQDTEEEQSEQDEEALTPTFLEEIMLDEFATAMTRPMAVWTGPAKQSEDNEEERKAALRRELMGSYLLE
jgi:hypothetical protein